MGVAGDTIRCDEQVATRTAACTSNRDKGALAVGTILRRVVVNELGKRAIRKWYDNALAYFLREDAYLKSVLADREERDAHFIADAHRAMEGDRVVLCLPGCFDDGHVTLCLWS